MRDMKHIEQDKIKQILIHLGRKAVKTLKRKIIEEMPQSKTPRLPYEEHLKLWNDMKIKEKIRRGLSNDIISERSKVSPATVGRIFSRNIEKDIKYSTIYAIDSVLPTDETTVLTPDAALLVSTFEAEAAKIREDAAREADLYRARIADLERKIAALEAQAVEMKALIATRGDFIKKLIDKID